MSDKKYPPNDGGATSLQGSLFTDIDGLIETKPSRSVNDASRRRKLQLCNGYLLEFNELSRVLNAIWAQRDSRRIARRTLVETTGLPDRHVESLVSMGSAMGLVKPGVQLPTKAGALVAAHDMFFERTGTLEWCHYKGAGSYRNLVWFDVFNQVLAKEEPMTHPEWNDWFRRELNGRDSDRTLRKVVQEEVHFVCDAYLNQRLAELGLIAQSSEGGLFRKRYVNVEPLVFCSMLYDSVEMSGARTSELKELTGNPGSPAMVFGLDTDSLRELVDGLHNNGWLRYETTHNLDQIRLKPDYDSMEFLTAYYERREPQPKKEKRGSADG